MIGKSVVELAADLGAGIITSDMIRDKFGDGILSAVLGFAGGTMAAAATHVVLDSLDEETGLVSDLGGLVNDILDIF